MSSILLIFGLFLILKIGTERHNFTFHIHFWFNEAWESVNH